MLDHTSPPPEYRHAACVVELFGGPRVFVDGAPVQLSGYQAALLLLVHGHQRGRIGRSEAVWYLWESDDDPRTRHRLRQLLHMLRRKLRRSLITADGDELVAARPADTVVDLDHFRMGIQQERLRDAARMARAGLGSALRDAPGVAFEQWLEGRAVALERLVLEHASRIWDAGEQGAPSDSVVEAAEALFLLQPGDPTHVYRAIEVRARAGRIASAEAAFVAYLHEVGGEQRADARVLDLMQRVRALEHGVAADYLVRRRHAPLVGRKPELAIADQLLTEAAGEGFRLLLVRGTAGIGKTRFLHEVRRRATLEGFRDLHAAPVEIEQQIGLNPIIDLLEGVEVERHLDELGQPWKAIVASLLPSNAIRGHPGEIPPVQESSLSRRLMDAFWMLFDSLAREQPVLMTVDDLQWADRTTLALLRFLQRRWRGPGFMLMCAMRPEFVRSDHPLAWFAGLPDAGEDEEGIATVIELGNLSNSESEELIRHLLAEDTPQDVRRYLLQLGANHPFYLTEVAKDFEADRLKLPERAMDTVAVPVPLQHILRTRMEHVGDEAMRLAHVLAARGRPMRLTHLAEVARVDLERCADFLEELARWDFVEADGAEFGIPRELIRSAVYRSMGDARRAYLHGRIAEFLEGTGSPDVTGELAIHFDRAGEREKAVRYGRLAAEEVLQSGAVGSAAQYFDIVVNNADDEVLRAHATADLARCLHMDRQIQRANPTLELAATRLRKAGDPRKALRMEIRRTEGLAELGALPLADLIARIGEVKKEAEAREDWEAVALALDVELHLHRARGDRFKMGQVFEELKTIATCRTGIPACLACISISMQVLYSDPRDALRSAIRAERLSRNRDPSLRFKALQRLHSVLLTLGMTELPSAQRFLDEARVLASRSGDLYLKCALRANCGVTSLDLGKYDVAEQQLIDAFAALHRADLALPRFNQQVSLGELYLLSHRVDEARSSFTNALKHTRSIHREDILAVPYAGLGLCELHEGLITEAREKERRMPPPDLDWDFDPYLVIRFLASSLCIRGRIADALEVVSVAVDKVESRLALSWIKLIALEAQIALRYRWDLDPTKLVRAYEFATRRRLLEREKQISQLLTRLRSR